MAHFMSIFSNKTFSVDTDGFGNFVISVFPGGNLSERKADYKELQEFLVNYSVSVKVALEGCRDLW